MGKLQRTTDVWKYVSSLGPQAMTPDRAGVERKLCEEATPGPWSACKDGSCKCSMVSCADFPIAIVTRGKWGDDYPTLRLVGDSIGQKAEAYMEQITYGEVSDEKATANARFIAHFNPQRVKAMLEEIAELEEFVRVVTSHLQHHRSKTPSQHDSMFDAAYRLYAKYDVEGMAAKQPPAGGSRE